MLTFSNSEEKERDNNTDRKVRNPPKDMKLDLDPVDQQYLDKEKGKHGTKLSQNMNMEMSLTASDD